METATTPSPSTVTTTTTTTVTTVHNTNKKKSTTVRSIIGKLCNVIGNVAWIVSSIVMIVGCGAFLTYYKSSEAPTLFIIGFAILCAGSAFNFLSDILTVTKDRNKRLIPSQWISGLSILLSSIALVIGSGFFGFVEGRRSTNSSAAGIIVWIVGSSVLTFGQFVKIIAAMSLNLAAIKKHSSVIIRIRGWATLLAPVIFTLASVLILLGSINYLENKSLFEQFGSILWIIGFSMWIVGSVMNCISLSPLSVPDGKHALLQLQQSVLSASDSNRDDSNIHDLILKLQLEKNNEERFYMLRSILLEEDNKKYNVTEVELLLSQFSWVSNKLEILKILIDSNQLELSGNSIASLISMINPVHRREAAQIIFSRPIVIDVATAVSILVLCESDETKYELLQIVAPHVHDKNRLWQLSALMLEHQWRIATDDTIQKIAPSAPTTV